MSGVRESQENTGSCPLLVDAQIAQIVSILWPGV
jgi:hypothetical protein